MIEPKSEKSPSILVVDDNLTIRHFLDQCLTANGYSVYLAKDGEKGIRAARENLPDLVLLDIIMPGMDGFEVCTRLKQGPDTQGIPVLFITTLHDVEIHKKAIECGGQGFITKPFSEDLLNAYVKIFLEKKKVFDAVETRADSQNRFMNMGIHDLNNLLFAVSSNLELAMLEGEAKGDMRKHIDRSLFILRSVAGMVHKFQEMLKLGCSEYQPRTDVVDMRKLLERTVSIFEGEMQSENLGFVFRGPRVCKVRGDWDLLERVMMNLLGNAVEFARAGTDISFVIESRRSEKDMVKFFLTNHCSPLPEKYREGVFEMFRQGPQIKKRQRGKGIGLHFCKSALEKQGGSIWIESPIKGQSQGFGVHFTLPGVF